MFISIILLWILRFLKFWLCFTITWNIYSIPKLNLVLSLFYFLFLYSPPWGNAKLKQVILVDYPSIKKEKWADTCVFLYVYVCVHVSMCVGECARVCAHSLPTFLG